MDYRVLSSNNLDYVLKSLSLDEEKGHLTYAELAHRLASKIAHLPVDDDNSVFLISKYLCHHLLEDNGIIGREEHMPHITTLDSEQHAKYRCIVNNLNVDVIIHKSADEDTYFFIVRYTDDVLFNFTLFFNRERIRQFKSLSSEDLNAIEMFYETYCQKIKQFIRREHPVSNPATPIEVLENVPDVPVEYPPWLLQERGLVPLNETDPKIDQFL